MSASRVRSVAEGAACPAGADEVEPHGTVLELHDRVSEPPPTTHRDATSRRHENRDEVSLNVRIHIGGRTEGQELVGDRRFRSSPAHMQVANRYVAPAAARREVVQQQTATPGASG
jgi:hypothetical protein